MSRGKRRGLMRLLEVGEKVLAFGVLGILVLLALVYGLVKLIF